jgi:pimeloyl-ACP methyl ester carboxylesterase
VLLHGFGGSARNFRPQARALRSRWRTALFDVRGHARSEAPRDGTAYAPERFEADLGRVLDHLGEERCVVGGLSMGAGIALRFALRHPERVRAMVLAAFPPAAGEGRQAGWATGFAHAIERDGLEAAGAVHAWGPESGLDPRAAALVRQGFLEHAPHALAHTLRRLLATQPAITELAPELAALAIPALVLVGTEDRVSLRASRALARALPDAQLVEIAGAGHVVNLEAREPFNAELIGFLEGLGRDPTPAGSRAAVPGRHRGG